VLKMGAYGASAIGSIQPEPNTLYPSLSPNCGVQPLRRRPN